MAATAYQDHVMEEEEEGEQSLATSITKLEVSLGLDVNSLLRCYRISGPMPSWLVKGKLTWTLNA